ncbi:MAG TPA: hypothetical protein VFX05_11020 [Casimicrobiaceae bacterium]|nr:hypothetical protein [Casimicrobiaceae bacterium]
MPSLSTRTRRLLPAGVLLALAVAVVLAWRAPERLDRPAAPAPAVAQAATPTSLPTGWIDEPAGDTIVGTRLVLSGWALDSSGIDRVEVRIAHRALAARYGLPRPDVASQKPDVPGAATSGFRFEADLADVLGSAVDVRHLAQVVAVGKGGGETVLGARHVVLATAGSPWRSLYEKHGGTPDDAFHVVPGLSGVLLGAIRDLGTAYEGYTSPTVRLGMRVPILYMRTTRGAKEDWRFDPDWDIQRRCGERRIAEDSLSAVIAHARKHRIPVLFTLNGGVWSDASCDVPEWDAIDHLEQDVRNVQQNQDGVALPDDYLKHLPGAQESPELARMLTFNVFAAPVRHYKRRNLQAAGRIVAAFARADPDLFVGINLDPDTAQNPFFEEKQWYDFNPDTVRQFRHWLAGSGPYQGRGGPDVPDLRAYRRAAPLTLADVRRLSGRDFRRWEDVDPPRAFPRAGDKPFWTDPWVHEWEVFRRHLIDLHYDELSRWLVDVGIPPSRIFSSQGFMAPHAAAMPFAVRVDSPSKNYDTGGISIEGAIPARGHLGAVLYGPAVRNEIRMETPDSLFATFHRMDPGWAIVEYNTADLRDPGKLPTYEMAYKAHRDAFNYGARLVSPMAWGGSDGTQAGQPGYVSYMAWRNTPLEDAVRDFALSHAYVPRGSRLWTFGSAVLATDDGWRAAGATLTPGPGLVELQPAGREVALESPPNLALGRGEVAWLVVGADAPERVARLRLELLDARGQWMPAGAAARDALERDPAGLVLPIAWPPALVTAEQVRVVLEVDGGTQPLVLRHVALYRAPRPRVR